MNTMETKNTPAVFNFEGHQVRTVVRDGKPWFVAADVADILEYRDAANMTRQLDDDEKGTQIMSTLGGDQKMSTITESGLYNAVLKSQKPQAKIFRKWITGEVIPSIHRTGSAMPKARRQPRTPPEADAFKLFPAAARCARVLGLDKNAAALSANVAVCKITGVDTLALLDRTHLLAEDQAHRYLTPTELGKRIDVTGRRFNQMLFEAGLQGCRSGTWVPIEPDAHGLYRLMDTGKRHSDGSMIQQLQWSEAVLERLPSQENIIPFPGDAALAPV
ncbi:MAG: Bro-N domain-containing protein [Azoarcus sp.]|jgi:prophage antirepressor-like protein|nr:Bro-N domain-containing protein [Azoarcus sp.]